MLEADKREAKHFREVVMTLQKYKTIMLRQLTQAEQSYAKVKEKYGLKRDFDLAKTLVLHNQTIIDEILSEVESQFGYKMETDKSIIKQHHAVQFDRIKTTLKVRKQTLRKKKERNTNKANHARLVCVGSRRA